MAFRVSVIPTHPPDPNAILRPGDSIAGFVSFFSPEAADILSVTVTFSGRAKSKIMTTRSNGQGTYTETRRNRDVWYSQPVTLYTGHYTLRQGVEYTWPFSFTLPTEVTVQPPKPDWLSSKKQQPAEVMPLPASFRTNCRFRGRQSGSYGAIQYAITAEVTRKGTLKDHTTEAEHFISLRGFRPGIVDPAFTDDCWAFAVTDMRLFPGMEDYHPSLKERLKETFGGDKRPKPTLAVNVKLSLPTNLVMGEGVGGKLWIEWDSERSHLLESPGKVKLVSVAAQLVSQTFITAGSQVGKNKTELPLATVNNALGGGCDMLYGIENAYDLGPQMSESFVRNVIDGAIVSSFDTVTVMRRYWIEVKVVFNCCGKKWKNEFRKDVNIVSGDEVRAPLPPPPMEMIEEGMGAMGLEDGDSKSGEKRKGGGADELPSYDDVGEGSSSAAAMAAEAARRGNGKGGGHNGGSSSGGGGLVA